VTWVRFKRYGPFVVVWGLAMATLYAASVRSHTLWPWVLGAATIVSGVLAALAATRS
jgi:hypothetical protein